jgi:hypothetical protein
LKATAQEETEQQGRYSYSLPMKNYDELRSLECQAPQLLVVLFLPADAGQWLVHSVERLVCQRCAFWVSLRGAAPSANQTAQTVYIPKQNYLSVTKLRELMERFSRREFLDYDG